MQSHKSDLSSTSKQMHTKNTGIKHNTSSNYVFICLVNELGIGRSYITLGTRHMTVGLGNHL